MRLSTNRILLSLTLLVTTALAAVAGPVFHSLDIDVTLHDNGDADVVETRRMTIDEVGTESYIVIGNLNGRKIRDFGVSDETGTEFRNIGPWDVDRSREQKTGQCGIVTKPDGYELCWGLGRSGARTYTIRYTVTNMVHAYEESDGFNFMFVARNITPSPEEATVTVRAPHRATGLPQDSVRVWSFGFVGESEKADGEVTVYTTEPMTGKSAMIVMLELDKGILHPAVQENTKFEEVKELAFEGSNYVDPPWYVQLWNYITQDVWTFCAILGFVFIGLWGIWTTLNVRRERKKLLKTVDWYRDIPLNGDLVHARSLYDAFYNTEGIETDDIISAMVLRLLRTGTLRVEQLMVQPTGLKRMMGGEAKMQPCIVIGEFNERNRLINAEPIRKLYDMFRQASGDDQVLQPRELRKWMNRHEDEVVAFVDSTTKKMSVKQAKLEIEDVRKVFGLKKFLSDFTLANERHMSEVGLWNDYLVYATLFGIADQVMADMKQLNPEFLQMSEITRNMTDTTVVPLLMATTSHTATSVKSAVESRRSGGGGSSSWGGGGGFSGGGSGGGVR